MKEITLLYLFIFSIALNAQNVIFPIDAATTTISGPTVTETVVKDGKIYVLTATNTAGVNAQLFDFGGRVQFRATFNSEATASWIVTITENGTPLNFTFGSVDYLILGSGTYNITNDSGDSIKSGTNLFMGGSRGTLSPDNLLNGTDIDGFNINSTSSFTDGPLTDVAFYNIEVNPVSLSTSQDKLKTVIIYPNPSNDKVFIQSKNLEEKKVTIYDVNGRVLKSVFITDVVDVSGLGTGVYFFKIELDNAIVTKRIVIN